MTSERRLDVARVLCQTNHEQDEIILTQGEAGDRFYILIEGSVSIVKNGREVNHLTGTSKTPQFFGERALLSKDVRAATVQVTSDKATTLSMCRASFDVLLRPSLVGPRRVAAAVNRRLLEDARERHVLRGSYQARAASGEGNEGYVQIIFMECCNDVVDAVRASRRARNFIETLHDDADATRIATSRRKRLLQKFRSVAHYVGRIQALHARARNAGQATDSAWRELQDALMSVGLASFALGSTGAESFGLGSKGLKSYGLGSPADKSASLRSMGLQGIVADAKSLQSDTKSVTLGGGSIVAALRSARKDLSRRAASVPRAPGALLKRLRSSKKAAIPSAPAHGGDEELPHRRRPKRNASVA